MPTHQVHDQGEECKRRGQKWVRVKELEGKVEPCVPHKRFNQTPRENKSKLKWAYMFNIICFSILISYFHWVSRVSYTFLYVIVSITIRILKYFTWTMDTVLMSETWFEKSNLRIIRRFQTWEEQHWQGTGRPPTLAQPEIKIRLCNISITDCDICFFLRNFQGITMVRRDFFGRGRTCEKRARLIDCNFGHF